MSEAKAGSIGVPSVSTMKGAFGDFAWGAVGGLVYFLSQALLGSGLLGALTAPVLAGSVIKGTRGTAIATMAGFMLLANMSSNAASASPASSTGVM